MSNEIAEYQTTQAALVELSQKYKMIVFDVQSAKGMSDAISARMELRNYRVGLEKMLKDIKAPALERCKLIDSEAKRIMTTLFELETPIDTAIKDEQERKGKEKRMREEREKVRVSNILDGISALKTQFGAGDSTPDELKDDIEALRCMRLDDYEEYAQQAAEARKEGIAVLQKLLAARLKRDEEDRARVAERAELDRLAAAHREQVRKDAEAAALAQAEADRKLQAAGDELERIALAQAVKLQMEKEEAAAARAVLDKKAAEERAELQRVENENRRQQEEAIALQEAALRKEREIMEEQRMAKELETVTLQDAATGALSLLQAEGYAERSEVKLLVAALDRFEREEYARGEAPVRGDDLSMGEDYER